MKNSSNAIEEEVEGPDEEIETVDLEYLLDQVNLILKNKNSDSDSVWDSIKLITYEGTTVL